MDVKNLSDLTQDEFQVFFDSFDLVLCDCDGVIWLLYKAIQGVPETIKKLRDHGKTVNFVSNNSVRHQDSIYDFLEKQHFLKEREGLTVPVLVLLDYLKEKNFEDEIFCVTMSTIKQQLKESGFKVASNAPDRIEESVAGVMSQLKDNPKVGAVLVDLDINLNYINLTLASWYLLKENVKFLALCSDDSVPVNQKFSLFGPYHFQKMLSDKTNKEMLHFGKPDDLMANYLKKKYNIKDPKRVLFIGDNLIQDISFANKNGFHSLLVLTGVTKKDDLKNLESPDQKPDFYLESLSVLENLIK